MTVTETLFRKILDLSEPQRQAVLVLVERLEHSTTRETWQDPYGCCADIRTDLSLEEFQQHRRELWGTSTAEESV